MQVYQWRYLHVRYPCKTVGLGHYRKCKIGYLVGVVDRRLPHHWFDLMLDLLGLCCRRWYLGLTQPSKNLC